jgi:hypothetical protein
VTAPLTLTLPMPPNIANGSHSHWRTRHREKIGYWADLDTIRAICCTAGWGHATEYRIPAPPTAPYRRATIRSTMHLGAAMDQSNSMRRHKWVEDWLVTRGYIADDRKKCLTWEAFPEQVVKRDGKYRLILTLTPSEP